VDLTDVSRMSLVRELEPNLFLYDVVVWSLSLKRKVRLAFLLDCRDPKRIGRVLLFSTDIHLDQQFQIQKVANNTDISN